MDERGDSDKKKRYNHSTSLSGGGSAGAVLANRLTANGRFSVTLIEAGRNSVFKQYTHVLKFINNPAELAHSSEPYVALA